MVSHLLLIFASLILTSAVVEVLGNSETGTSDGLQVVRPGAFKLKRFLDFFGATVSLDGNTMLVGASFASNGGTGPFGGVAYVFDRDTNGDWIETAMLQPNEGHQLMSSWNVALQGDIAVVGALTESTGAIAAGAAFLYKRTTNTSQWTLLQKLKAPTPEPLDYFGLKVAINGDTIVVAAQYEDAQGIIDSGSVFVYVKNVTSGLYAYQATIQASDTSDFKKFGSSISIKGNTLAVGAPSDKEYSPGAIYIYTRNTTDSTWSEEAKIVPTDLGTRGNFGDSISISGDTVAAGNWDLDHWTGAVYIFTRSGTTWTQQAKLTNPNPVFFEFYSWAISLEGDTLAVGGWFSNYLKGNVYVYKRASSVWTESFVVPGQDVFGLFGSAISLNNGRLAIGAMAAGAVYFRDIPVWA